MRRTLIAIALLACACGTEDAPAPECYVWTPAYECLPCKGSMYSNWIPGGYEHWCEEWLDDGGTRAQRCTLTCEEGPPEED